MPEVKSGEIEKEFIKRCIPIVLNDGTAKDSDQAVAICYSIWRRYKKQSLKRNVKELCKYYKGENYARK